MSATLALAIVALLVAGTAVLLGLGARRTLARQAQQADRIEARVEERAAALANLVDRRVAAMTAQLAAGPPVAGSPVPAGPVTGGQPAPDAALAPGAADHVYLEARLSQVSADLEALVADLLRRHAASVRVDALAAAAQSVAGRGSGVG